MKCVMYLFHNKDFRLFKISKKIDPSPLKECHGIRSKVIKRLAIFRLRINKEKKKIQKRAFGSKSMAMRAIVR